MLFNVIKKHILAKSVFKFSSEEAKEIGNSIGVDWSKIDLEQFRIGVAVELEHGGQDPQTNVIGYDLEKAGKIAWAHLKESPSYYTKLKQVESVKKKSNLPSDPRLQQLSQIRSFAGRIRFCDENFQKIRAGSGRIVYVYDANHAIKLARNDKGIAQNGVENDGFINRYDIVARVVYADPDEKYLISEKAQKITPKQFEQLAGFSLRDWELYLKDFFSHRSPNFFIKPDEHVVEKVRSSEWATDVLDMMGNFDMPVGDMGRASTYGKIGDRLVVTDYGLTQSVYEEHYERRR
jgi:hypothetical protein